MDRSIFRRIVPVVFAVCAAVPSVAETLVERARSATERFVEIDVARAEGYRPIACASGPAGGAMGVHFVNADYLHGDEDTLDISKPEAIMYEPQSDGRMELVGLEYITFEGPADLHGHLLNYKASPNRYGLDAFYELHVWAFQENPAGPFADMNANVSCEFATGVGKGDPILVSRMRGPQ